MRTLLNEIKLIDNHLFNQANAGDALLFDAMLILNPALKENVLWQKKTHAIIQQYSRKKLKAEIDSAHQRLFTEPAHKTFRQRIWGLFW
jgi:hypothetical protein